MDHQRRDGLEHKVERELVKSATVNSPLQIQGPDTSSPSGRSELRSRFSNP